MQACCGTFCHLSTHILSDYLSLCLYLSACLPAPPPPSTHTDNITCTNITKLKGTKLHDLSPSHWHHCTFCYIGDKTCCNRTLSPVSVKFADLSNTHVMHRSLISLVFYLKIAGPSTARCFSGFLKCIPSLYHSNEAWGEGVYWDHCLCVRLSVPATTAGFVQ